MIGVSQYPRGVGEERFGHLEHLADAGLPGFVAPVFKEGFHLLAGGLVPEFVQFLLQVPSQQERLIELERFVQFGNLIGT
jgi:hypothetical protein